MKQTIKQRRISQRNLERITRKNLVWHIIIVFIMMLIALFKLSNQTEVINNTELVNESQNIETIKPNVSTLIAYEPKTEDESSKVEVDYYQKFTYSKDCDGRSRRM